MPNAKDYQGEFRNYLVYGMTGSGKSSAFLSYPGPKFAYVFDPSGLETFAGHDVEYELFVPDIVTTKQGTLGKGSSSAKIIRPDPLTYEKFEADFEQRVGDGYFLKRGGIIGFESATTLLELLVWYILDKQGRGNSVPEIQDYWFRADGFAKLMRVALAQRCEVFCSAHIETAQDETTKVIETGLAFPQALKNRIPLLFSEIIPLKAEVNEKDGTVNYFAHFAPTKRIQQVRTSLKGMKPLVDITMDWKKPLEGQGFFGLYKGKNAQFKSPEELAEQNKIRMDGSAPPA